MSEVLKYLAVTTLSGGSAALLLFVLRPVTRRIFSPAWQYYIWLVALFLLVFPISMKHRVYTQDAYANYITETSFTETASRPVAKMGQKLADKYKDSKKAVDDNKRDIDISKIIVALWSVGALSIFSVKIIKYIVFKRTIYKSSHDFSAEGLPRSVALRKTAMLDSPLMTGVFRPIIFLPDTDISEESLSYILKHELTHYKRRDILYKWLVMVISCIHWFDPIVYLAAKCIDEDCEVSCDNALSKNMTAQERRSYMNMLLDIALNSVNKSGNLMTYMSGSKRLMMRRFTAIKKGKVSIYSIILGIAAAIIVSGSLVYGANVVNDGVSAVKSRVESNFLPNDELYFSYGNNVLLIGTLDTPKPLAEFAMIINCQSGISVLSIPTEAKLGENMSLRYDFMGENREGVIEALENKLGIHIDRYAVFNINALKTIADKEKGVDVYIANKMYFADTTGVKKEFRRGINKLYGEDIMDVLLFKNLEYGNAENILNLFSGYLPIIFEKENLEIIDSNIISTDIEGGLSELSAMLKQACYKRVNLMLLPWRVSGPSDKETGLLYGYDSNVFIMYDRQPDMKNIRLQLTDIAG